MNSPYRPSWAVGITNQQLHAIARQEGLNPYHPDWADGLDSRVIREARQGAYQNPTAPTAADLKHEAASEDQSEAASSGRRNMNTAIVEANTEYVNGLFEDSCGCKARVDVLIIKRWNRAGFRVKQGEHGYKVDEYTLFCKHQVKEVRA